MTSQWHRGRCLMWAPKQKTNKQTNNIKSSYWMSKFARLQQILMDVLFFFKARLLFGPDSLPGSLMAFRRPCDRSLMDRDGRCAVVVCGHRIRRSSSAILGHAPLDPPPFGHPTTHPAPPPWFRPLDRPRPSVSVSLGRSLPTPPNLVRPDAEKTNQDAKKKKDTQ